MQCRDKILSLGKQCELSPFQRGLTPDNIHGRKRLVCAKGWTEIKEWLWQNCREPRGLHGEIIPVQLRVCKSLCRLIDRHLDIRGCWGWDCRPEAEAECPETGQRSAPEIWSTDDRGLTPVTNCGTYCEDPRASNTRYQLASGQ